MKRIVSLMFLLLLMSAFLDVHLATSNVSFGVCWEARQNFQTIQEAIDAANPGDTIFVASGIYKECLRIWKPLTLIGESSATTKIDGNNLTVAVTITASNVIFTRFTVCNSKSHGVFINNAAYCNISHNLVTDNSEHGVYLLGSSYNVISNNTIKNNKNGGIILHFSPNNKLRNNNMTNNRFNFGVFAVRLPLGSLPKDFFEDIDPSNKVNGRPIYYWINQFNREVPLDAGYIAGINSTNVSIKNLSINKNVHGTLLAFSTNITIENICCTQNMEGVYLWYSHKNRIVSNEVFENSLHGIHLLFSDRNLVAYNVVSNNTDSGIFLEDFCKHNILLENKVSENIYGVFLWPSYYNIIKGNNIFDNDYGVCQDGARHNKVYNNNFLNNTIQVLISDLWGSPRVQLGQWLSKRRQLLE